MVRVINCRDIKEVSRRMQDIWVDPEGIKIMAPKATSYILKINSLNSYVANILKQQSLSEGADVAIARNSITGKMKKTDCLVMANMSQIERISLKLKRQPFGLNRIADEIKDCVTDYTRDSFRIDLDRFTLRLGKRTLIMGIINLTPDSFSGDGLLKKSKGKSQKAKVEEIALEKAKQMIRDGADIIDIGGQSSRPGSRAVSVDEEIKRTIPVIKKLSRHINVPISIDTYRSEVARQALDNGACIVNDISSVHFDKGMSNVVKKYKAGLVLMHMQGRPKTMQKKPEYQDVMQEVIGYLSSSIKFCLDAGIDKEKIIIDPGIGFGKTLEHNLSILKNLRELKVLGRPILIGVSRKSFIGSILKAQPDERLMGTLASCVCAIANGADILRVHDVKEISEGTRIVNKILNANPGRN